MLYLLLSLLCAGAATWIAHTVVRGVPIEDGDFFTFWGGGRAVLLGLDPYDPATWGELRGRAGSADVANPTFVYPLPVALVLAPFAILPIRQAAVAWLAVSQLMIVGSALLTMAAIRWRNSLRFVPFIMLGLILFRPTLLTILNGQLSGLAVLGAAAGGYAWSRRAWFAGGMLGALIALKPTGALVALPTVGLWLLFRRQWSGLAGIACAVVLAAALGSVVQPGWLTEWVSLAIQKVGFTSSSTFPPTLWGWSNWLSRGQGNWRLWLAAAVAVWMAIGLLITLRAQEDQQWSFVLGVVLPMSLCVSPYMWNYDNVMLIPAIVLAAVLLALSDVPFYFTALLPVAFGVLSMSLLMLALTLGHDGWAILLPLTATAAFLTSHRVRQRRLHL